jgi:hypothetical protein
MPMQIDRRKLLVLTTLTALGSQWRRAAAADDERSLFWRVTFGNSSGILFGYERIAATLVPDIVKDGFRFIDGTKSMIEDLSPVVKFPPLHMDLNDATPLSKIVSQQTDDELQGIYAKNPQLAKMALASGLAVTLLLMGEGQTPPNPSAGGTILEHGKTLNRPTTILVTDAEAQGLWNPPDLAALNKSIDEPKIRYLLDLRKQVGPIGAHLETLYRERRGEEISRFTADIRAHGIVSFASFLPADRIRPLLLDRLEKTMAAGTVDAFVLLPLGLLTGKDGILAALRVKGNTVTAVA